MLKDLHTVIEKKVGCIDDVNKMLDECERLNAMILSVKKEAEREKESLRIALGVKQKSINIYKHEIERIKSDARKEADGYKNMITSLQKDIKKKAKTLSEELIEDHVRDTFVNIHCCICFVKRRKTLLMPCKHLALCKECSRKISECPMCRSRVEGKIEVYF
jgi:predicted RNA-binding protein with RPS1 domain